MRKVILFLSVIGIAAFMTSCLKGGNNNFREASVVYINSEGGQNIGNTLTGKMISSTQIDMMMPGSLYVMVYSWDEEYGTIPVGENGFAYKVQLLEESKKIDVQHSIPTGVTPPVEEVKNGFVSMPNAQISSEISQYISPGWEQFMGDHWVFEYGYMAKEKESARVSFTLNEEKSNIQNNELVFDLQLAITGGAEDDKKEPQRKIGIIGLNMSEIRNKYQGKNKDKVKELKIKVSYYRERGNNNQKEFELTDRNFTFPVYGD